MTVTDRPPVIGVTTCGRLDDYVQSVERAGGRARVLQVSESPRALISELDGLLLTGGGDVDPVFYGEDRHPSVQDAEPGRDEFEMDLVRRALDADLPVLAICRGAQVLNVASGGSLVQDIPSAGHADVAHSVLEPKDAVAHDIRVAPGSRLERALGPAAGPEGCRVNSRHHQSIKTIGRNLVSAATAPDGVIESVEAPGARFCIGVQWHPENFWRSGEFSPLFDAFLAAARRGR
ncbi:gamma-glutamyl-gamma-aminobutyrate hydrolase family protein [soil metagenome]